MRGRIQSESITAFFISRFFLTALIVGLLLVPGAVFAQSSDTSQDSQAQDQQEQMSGPDQDMQDQGPPPSMSQPAPGQSDREPMSEMPPPLKPSPNIQGSGPYGRPPYDQGNQGYGNSAETSENTGVARVSMIHGDVSTQRGDSGEWSAAQVNAPLVSGDKVSTGDKARVELQLDFANILRLSEHTQANITNLTRSQIQIQMGHGMANFTVLHKSEVDAEIDAPNVAIRTEKRDSSFRILVTADDHTEVLVRKGEVEITTPQGGTRVGENQFITIRGSGADTQYRIGEAPARDDWDQWNTDRDRMIGNSVSRRHTNDYYVGSQDLDNNGTWKDVPDYGSVWEPNEGADWAPYRDGRWVYEPYWGWTWVSYEPWGWAPYHYGRWLQLDGAWAWWPGPVYGYPYYRPLWAPAYVSFFGFGGGVGFGVGWGWGSIGWFPIGPCDFFHPWWGGYRGRFGYTNFRGYDRGGFAPLHRGNRFSNVRSAMNDSHFRGASSVAGNQFGKGGGHFQPVSHSMMQNAHFATGNLPVVPGRESLSASGRPAAASTLANRGGNQHFFSPHGTSTAASTHSFAREQAQVSSAMRQNGISPVNGSQRSMESHSGLASRSNEARSGEQSSRGFNQGASNAARSNTENRGNLEARGNSNAVSSARTGPTDLPRGGSGGWQKFTPMAPRSPAESSTGRSTSGVENRGGVENHGGMENRGSYGSPRGSSGYPGSVGRGPEGRGYGSSRPPLNMRQPIATPRSYGGNPYGGRGYSAPSYGGRSAPGYGGRSAPSFGGSHSAPSGHGGGAPHGGGSSHSGGSSHGGGGGSHGGGGGHGHR